MSNQAEKIYQSFLVRCWLMLPETPDELTTWRFELQEISAEPQKQRFGDFEQLKMFMSARLAAIANNNAQANEGDNRQGDTS
jgi:hypothetical protein